MSILVHNKISNKSLPAKKEEIITIASLIIKEINRTLKELNIYIIDDCDLLKMNKKIKKKNELTDTISINLGEGNIIDGEIFISLERIEDNSRIFNTTLKEEFMRVVIHSVLHLCGYKDDNEQYRLEMNRKEDYFLGRFVSRETDVC
jgi:probable rRNA maturation factor